MTVSPTALLSGGTGYIGSHIRTRLVERGFDVVIVSRRPAPGHILSTRQLDELIDEAVSLEPDIVIHAAGAGGASSPPAEWRDVIEANLTVGIALLEAATRLDRPLVALGSFFQHSVRRGAVVPNSVYAAAKTALEHVAASFAAHRATSATFLHLSDVYGPDDPRPRLLPALAAAVHSGTPLDMSGGEQEVSFVHVSDVADAVIAAVDASPVPGVNRSSVTGPHRGPLRSTIEHLAVELDINIPVRWGARQYRNNELMVPEYLPWPIGWRPRITLAQGFRELVERR
ncbi:MAG: NAD-dependent epimerase/dehydratase family protein [Ilumatobacteraceae bacterium]